MILQGCFDRLGYQFLNVHDAMSESPQTSFLGPGKVILLLVLGLLVYGVTLVFWVPAGWLWHKASAHIQLPPQVQVQQISGQLWSGAVGLDRKSTRLNSSHVRISYAVFCLKKKNNSIGGSRLIVS